MPVGTLNEEEEAEANNNKKCRRHGRRKVRE
jgi:hypothetical protein